MANEIKKDSKLDIELAQMKQLAEIVKRDVRIFMTNYNNIPPKERANMVRGFQDSRRKISQFIEDSKKEEIINTGTKYSIETLKQARLFIDDLWRKLERMLEDGSLGGSAGISKAPAPTKSQTIDPLQKAAQDYKALNSQLGVNLTPEQLRDFNNQLKSAFETTKSKLNGADLDVQVTADSGKIKVKFRPKTDAK